MNRFVNAACTATWSLLALNALAQQPVTVGKGAYAASIPPGIVQGQAEATDNQPISLMNPTDRPIPSNKWFQTLLLKPFGTGLWTYPLKVDTGANGLSVFFPTAYHADGNGMEPGPPLLIGARDFHPTGTRVKDWTDWTVAFRLSDSPTRTMDVTLGEGMPYVWIETHGLEPLLHVGAAARFFGIDGKSVSLPATSDALGITCDGRNYGLFGPDGARFRLDGENLAVSFTAAKTYLVLCPLNEPTDIALMHRYAFGVPRNTEYTWKYDGAAGTITTTWNVTTELLKGVEHRILQGWLPHHYKETQNDLAFAPLSYLTPRGAMKCAPGNAFHVTYNYSGMLPNMPAPRRANEPHPFDPPRMASFLSQMAAKPSFGGDTYWGGKDLLLYAQAALMAQQTHDPAAATLRKQAADALADWFTYRPGKKEHYFAYYPKRKGLVGFNSSYGSEHFSDNHFHYGYFTMAAGIVAMLDPQFAADYGAMARLVAKQYADWDRTDTRFPYLRTFDIWQGHSWADGNGFGDGNNQESTSEAAQSWAGLILLGAALKDNDMVAAGVMGHTIESRAAMYYWFNQPGDIFPAGYKHPSAGMIWSNGLVWGTWFSGSAAWIYGIQWLPMSPALYYLGRDQALSKRSYETMLRESQADEDREIAKNPSHVRQAPGVRGFGPDLGGLLLAFAAMYDAPGVCAQFDAFYNEPGDKFGHDARTTPSYYYQAHALAQLGRVDWACHGSSATSMVFSHGTAATRTFVASNPTAEPLVVRFYEGARPLGEMTAAPRDITTATTLTAAD